MNTDSLHPLKHPGKYCLFSLVSVGLLVAPLTAAVLLEDSFDYTVNSGLSGNNGGTGFSSAWSVGGGIDATVTDGLSFDGLSTSGGAARITSTNATSSLANRTSGTAASTSVIYGSFLFQSDGSPISSGGVTTGSTWIARFIDGSYGTVDYAVLPFYGGSSYNGLSASYTTGTYYSGTQVAPSIYDGSTYMFVSKITGLGGSGGTLDVWVLDEAGLAAARLDGMTDQALTDNTITNGHLTVTGSTWVNLGINDIFQMGGYPSNNVSDTTSFILDEIRYGESLVDVTPIPETTTSALLMGLGLSALLVQRGKQRSR